MGEGRGARRNCQWLTVNGQRSMRVLLDASSSGQKNCLTQRRKGAEEIPIHHRERREAQSERQPAPGQHLIDH